MGPAALQGRDPDLVRLEVDVARAKAKRFGHAAPGHREGPGEGLHGGLRMRARHGEEALALKSRQVLSPARVDQLAHHRSSPFRPSDPKRYISVWRLTTSPSRPSLSATRTLAIAAGPRLWPVRKRDRMNRILSVVRSMTDKIIELSRAVVTAPAYGESNGGLESVRSTY